VAAGPLPVDDAGAAAGGHLRERDTRRDVSHPEPRDQGDPQARGHQGQDGGEVVGVVADARREAAGLAGAERHGVAPGTRAARDPRDVAAAVDASSGQPGLPGRGDQVDRFLEQRFFRERGVGFSRHVVVDEGEGDVDGSRVQGTGDGDRVKLGHHELKSRVLAAEGDQGRGQDGARRRREGADAQPARQAGAGGGERGRGLLQDREDGLGVADQDDAGRGQGHAPAGALEQRHAGLALQGGELLRDGGRGVRERVGDRGDRSPVGQFEQQPEPAHVDH
jgi:hypothetical protein